MLDINETKVALADSLRSLMAEKPLGKISICEIVEKSGYHRQTFYYYFHDIYELLEWLYQYDTREMRYLDNSLESTQFAMLKMLQYVQENSEAVLNAFDSLGYNRLHQFLFADFQKTHYQKFCALFHDLNIDNEFINFLADFFVASTSGYLLNWLNNGMKESPEQIVEWFTRIFTSIAHPILDSPPPIQ